MADLPVQKQFLVKPTSKVKEMWIDVQIQEKKSRIVKTIQDIEDLEKGMKVKLQAAIIMLEKEIEALEDEKVKGNSIDID